LQRTPEDRPTKFKRGSQRGEGCPLFALKGGGVQKDISSFEEDPAEEQSNREGDCASKTRGGKGNSQKQGIRSPIGGRNGCGKDGSQVSGSNWRIRGN